MDEPTNQSNPPEEGVAAAQTPISAAIETPVAEEIETPTAEAIEAPMAEAIDAPMPDMIDAVAVVIIETEAPPADEAAPGQSEYTAAVIVPETPEEVELLDLLGIPLLGPARAKALADAGLKTRADLAAADVSRIAGVKGVGARNAERIKDWIADNQQIATPANAAEDAAADQAADDANEMLAGGTTVEDIVIEELDLVSDLEIADELLQEALAMDQVDVTPLVIAATQLVQETLGRIDESVVYVKKIAGKGGKAKKLQRQLRRLSTVVGAVPETFETLKPKKIPAVSKALIAVAEELDRDTKGKPTEKKLDTAAEKLRTKRKKLEAALGG